MICVMANFSAQKGEGLTIQSRYRPGILIQHKRFAIFLMIEIISYIWHEDIYIIYTASHYVTLLC